MAKRPKSDQSAGEDTRRDAAPPPNPRDAIIDATMALAAERSWEDIELADIAQRAGVTLAQLRESFPSKGAVLGGFSKRIDRIVLDGMGHDLDDESPKERLFDVLMRRLDAMAPYREALRGIRESVRFDPVSMAALNQLALNSHRYMLAAAGIGTEGPAGALKLQGVVLMWSRVLDTWFRDEDPGMARTMAKLDKELARGGRMVSGLNDLCRLASPFRALLHTAASGGRRFRERERAERSAPGPEDEDSYAPA